MTPAGDKEGSRTAHFCYSCYRLYMNRKGPKFHQCCKAALRKRTWHKHGGKGRKFVGAGALELWQLAGNRESL